MSKSDAKTNIGLKRKLNQDMFFISDTPVGNLQNLYIVADGMGGHNAGDMASRYTVDIMVERIRVSEQPTPERILLEAIEEANRFVRQKAYDNLELYGMGTTVVAATLVGNHMLVANVGDSRLYLVGDTIEQITVDHSLVEEMVQMGGIDRAVARTHPDKNIITRAIGPRENVVPDFFHRIVEPGQLVLLCSDGLTNMVEDEQIRNLVMGDGTISEKVDLLVDEANKNGGKDNISVIIVDPFEE